MIDIIVGHVVAALVWLLVLTDYMLRLQRLLCRHMLILMLLLLLQRLIMLCD